MNKKLAVILVIPSLCVGFMVGVASNIGYADRVQKVTVIGLADIQKDGERMYARRFPNPVNVTQKVWGTGESEALRDAAAGLQ